MATPPVVRPKMPQELRLKIFQEIINHPEIGSREIIQNLLKEDPGNVVFFYSAPVSETFTLDELVTIWNGNTVTRRKTLFKDLKRDRTGEYAINPGVITRAKNSLNKGVAPSSKHGAIYGASNLGYVVEKAMNANRAARWLYPRIAQIQHECMAWNKCGQLLSNSGSPERKKAADDVHRYIRKAMVYRDVKRVADGIRDRFIRSERDA